MRKVINTIGNILGGTFNVLLGVILSLAIPETKNENGKRAWEEYFLITPTMFLLFPMSFFVFSVAPSLGTMIMVSLTGLMAFGRIIVFLHWSKEDKNNLTRENISNFVMSVVFDKPMVWVYNKE